jgi:pimeloyl-ACP methyl ester carboxylesterase
MGNARNNNAVNSAKFTQKPIVTLARLAMGRLDRVAPGLAARMTCSLISSPPRHRPSDAEALLRASAHQWRIPFQDGWLQCYRWGKGPQCLFVHCWGGRGTQPEAMIRQLTESGLSVVSFDHPAHGLSSGKWAEQVRMAQATAAVVHDVGAIDTLIAHSLGVAATAIALRDYELDVRRLISISSLTDCTWFTNVIGAYLGISTQTVAKARARMDANYAQPMGWESLSIPHMLAHLTIPMMLVHDRDDLEIPFEHALTIQQTLQHAELIATTGLGHRRILKDPAVIEQIKRFAHQGQAS